MKCRYLDNTEIKDAGAGHLIYAVRRVYNYRTVSPLFEALLLAFNDGIVARKTKILVKKVKSFYFSMNRK